MPCTALARGIRQTPPHTSLLPFNDAINNNPCGKPAVTSVAGVSVAAESLCPNHWIMKHGYRDWVGPFVVEGGGGGVEVAFGEQGEGTDGGVNIGFNNPSVTICAQKDAVLATPIATLTALKAKVRCVSGFTLRASVYASPFGARLDYGVATAFPVTDGWITIPLGGAALPAGTYSLAIESSVPGANVFVYATSDAVNFMRYAGGAFPGTPATPCAAANPLNFRLSMYAVGNT